MSTDLTASAARERVGVDGPRVRLRGGGATVALVVVLALLPFLLPNAYWTGTATLVLVFWILVSGLTLVVGYAGQLSVGHVGLLAVGAYTACSVSQHFGIGPFLALVAAALVGAIAGLLIGLPSLRLRRFYFAMATLGFATVVSQLAVVWRGVTGGGTGIAAPTFSAPFDTPGGFYWLVLLIALVATLLTWLYGRSNSGRALIAIRDAEVAAESVGVPTFRLKLVAFTFSGLLAGVSGGLYSSVQTYITPDAFTFDLSMLFFTAVLLGGRGRILAPAVATAVLVILPQLAAPLEKWSAFLYAVLLLVVVLLLPNGVGGLVDRLTERFRGKRDTQSVGELTNLSSRWRPGLARPDEPEPEALSVVGAVKEFGGVRALDRADLSLSAGSVHGLIGPNGSGKTTVLNALSGYYALDGGRITLGKQDITQWSTQRRARGGIARCFQAPRLPGELTALENVMLGAYTSAEIASIEAFTGLGRYRRLERQVRTTAYEALAAVGLSHIHDVKADRIQHSQQRFLEIARSIASDPAFLLLDEPAAGLASDEIEKLAALVRRVADSGTAVLLVEHHSDLVFEVSDEVTVLNFGQVLAHGSPSAVRADESVVHAYLGA